MQEDIEIEAEDLIKEATNCLEKSGITKSLFNQYIDFS
jgi:hypothetical protein